MKTVVYRIHYGFEAIYQSIESIHSWADRIVVAVSKIPWYNEKTINYLGNVVEIVHPENIDEEIEKLKKIPKVEVVIEEYKTQKRQWGYLINKYASEYVLAMDADMIFPFEVEETDSILTWKQIEFWKNKNWRIPLRNRRGPVLYKNPSNINTRFGALPTHGIYKVSNKLVHNIGLCYSEPLMLYKHLLAMGFSKPQYESIPNERWYVDKWLNWTPETENLGISLGDEHKIKRAIQVE